MVGEYIKLSDTPFPLIQRADELKARVSHKDEIRFLRSPDHEYTTVSYVVAGADTFDDSYSRECRGIVFDSTGEVVSRPLHKFFNVNERQETMAHELDWTKVARVMHKRDGSMIHTVKHALNELTPDVELGLHRSALFTFKSKKSFTSDVAQAAKRWILSSPHRLEVYIKLGNYLAERDLTGIFEFTSPRARIVIGYPEDALTLLHVRDNQTGRYATRAELVELRESFNVPLVKTVNVWSLTWTRLRGLILSSAEEVEGLEGWVIQFENGEMVKLKSRWYMDRHRAMTFLRVRDIARLVLTESLDDLKSQLVGDGIDISEILEIEQRVVDDVRTIEQKIDEAWAPDREIPRKDFALKHMKHPFFGLLMQRYSGKEPTVKEYFERNCLDKLYDLTQLNLTDSVAEVE